MQSIDQKAFLNINVSLPPLEKQKAFVRKYAETQAHIRNIRLHLDEVLADAARFLDREMT